jgi:hypothetical protein
MNPSTPPTPNTDSNAAADSATATDDEPEGFAEFRRESRQVFAEVERLAASWGLRLAIRQFSDLALSPSNASGLFLAEETARQFAGVPAGYCAALVRLESATDLPGFYWGEFVQSVLAHEIGHCVVSEFERSCGQRPVMIPRALFPQTLSLSAVEVDELFKAEKCPPWTGHELQFLRAASHIRERMAMGGHFTSAAWVLPNAYYSLSPMSWFESCFADELQQFADRPITEVLQAPYPTAAVQLFADDVRRWARSQQRRQQPTTTRDNTHGRENSQTRENSEAQGPPGRRTSFDDSSEEPSSATV